MPRLALVAASVAALTGCSVDLFSGDPFPIAIDRSTGAVLVPVRVDSAETVASIDVMAPITVVDRGVETPVRRRTTELTLLGPSPDAGTVARARLTADVFELHPCDASVPCRVARSEGATCADTDQGRCIGVVIGADALAGDAIRFDFAENRIFVLPDIAGADSARNKVCDGVLQSPFRGGGTLLLDGAEVPFGGRRIAIGACMSAPAYLHNAADAPDPKPGGADVLLVLSTGVGITILGDSAYRRLRDALTASDRPPAVDPINTQPDDTVVLSSGTVKGWRRTVSRLALVATTGSNPRGPCREVYTHRLMTRRACATGEDCPCGDRTTCGAPAVVELDRDIHVLVVVDADPTLQSLRAELRPDEAEVDGILGTDALTALQLDIDYPHNRLLARCSGTGCLVRPQLVQFSTADREQVRACMPDAGVPDAELPDAGVLDATETEPAAP